MRLLHASASPFVRKVMVLAQETALIQRQSKNCMNNFETIEISAADGPGSHRHPAAAS